MDRVAAILVHDSHTVGEIDDPDVMCRTCGACTCHAASYLVAPCSKPLNGQ